MNKEILIKTRKGIGAILGWGFGLFFLLMAIALLFDPSGNYKGVICFLIASLMLLPPAWNRLNINLEWRKVLSIKLIVTVILFGLAINTDTAFNGQNHKSSADDQQTAFNEKQHNLYQKLLELEVKNVLGGYNSLLNADAWMKELQVKGTQQANRILKEFKDNEVAAAQKYDAPWIIEGRITKIDDGFLSATIGLDGDRFFNLDAEMKNKDRVATYKKGDSVKLYCENISEAVTLIFVHDCVDFNDWLKISVIKAEKSLYRTNTQFRDQSDNLKQIISNLSEEHICYNDLTAQNCKKLFKAL